MDRRIVWVTEQMEARLAAPLTVADLASEVNLSPSRFAHLFHDQVGTSPARYLHVLRMTRARLLLERTFLSIKEVMAHVGCNDPSHFSRDFRRFHGASPREWRDAAARRRLQDASDAVASATVLRVAALANGRENSPTESPASTAATALRVHSDDGGRRGRYEPRKTIPKE